MSRETLKNLIELVPENEIDILYHVIVKFIPEADPEPGEIEAILDGRKDRAENGTVSHEEIDWG
ncbi:MAG: hypothetical protein KH330_16325 [Clostridiales bacterium]|nr:hypothetical protein [Clostridiales bacterium]